MKKKSKKPGETLKVTPEYDSVRETGILLEQIKDQITVVGEQHGFIIKKLEKHDGEFDKMNNKLEIVEDKIMASSYKIDTIEKKLDVTIKQNDQRFKKIENKIGI